MQYFVTSGSIERKVFAFSFKEAVINFLNAESGPFGTIIAVSKQGYVDTHFFHTKTMLKSMGL